MVGAQAPVCQAAAKSKEECKVESAKICPEMCGGGQPGGCLQETSYYCACQPGFLHQVQSYVLLEDQILTLLSEMHINVKVYEMCFFSPGFLVDILFPSITMKLP